MFPPELMVCTGLAFSGKGLFVFRFTQIRLQHPEMLIPSDFSEVVFRELSHFLS